MQHSKHSFQYALAVLLLAACLSLDGLCAQQATQSSANQLVTLHVAVSTNGGGGYVSNINKPSFVVYDNKVAQEIKVFKDGSVPASICIVINTHREYREGTERVTCTKQAGISSEKVRVLKRPASVLLKQDDFRQRRRSDSLGKYSHSHLALAR